MRRFALGLLLAAAPASAAGEPGGFDSLKASIAEARSFAADYGATLWPGYESAPFEVLLIGEDREELLCRAAVPSGFTDLGADPATGCGHAMRPRSGLPSGLLAAMPLFGPPATIVMGTPAATKRDPAAWIRTILHEHFHQWQYAQPGYYPGLAALDLADGDETGMWMLDFAFPYDDPAVGRAYARASKDLAEALAERGTPRLESALTRYLASRRNLASAAGERSWRYAELQLWQEGVARWTEIEFGKHYPAAAVREASAALERETIAALGTPDLVGQRREFAYPIGAGEAMLLEACLPRWRDRYADQFALGPLLERARTGCRAAS
jgi:hypothetical protein